MRRWVYVVVALVAIARVYVAAHLPLTEDEAYHWIWSRHLAFGYLDHPPAVAWFIAAGSWLGNSTLAVRLPFILLEAAAALFLGAVTFELSGDARAAGIAAMALTFFPQVRFAVGEARPEAPYVAFWALALWMAVRLVKRADILSAIVLGIALGGAVLSRTLGWWLVVGIAAYFLQPEQRRVWKIAWLSFFLAAALYAPFLVWNAHHGWANVFYSARDQQLQISTAHFLSVAGLRTLVLALLIWIAYMFTAYRLRLALIGWTALPCATLLVLLSPIMTVESYWLLGPLTSLCAGVAIALSRATSAWRRFWTALWAIAVAGTACAVTFLALPEAGQAAVLDASGERLKALLYSEVFTYPAFATDVARLSREHRAGVLTDRYEIAAELLRNGVPAELIGQPQAQQWHWWHAPAVPNRALVITFSPIASDEDFVLRLRRAFRRVTDGGVLEYSYAHTIARRFYIAWGDDAEPNAAGALYPP